MVARSPQTQTDKTLVADLRQIVGYENVLADPDELLVYECDGLPQHKYLPRAVVFPNTTEETAAVVGLLHEEDVSFAPRGAGTGLSGGALAIDRGVVVELARMRKILDIDVENRLARVQTGLVNAQLSRAVAPYGLYYVPDPSSQPSCTIGGNIAENAGGIHCLKYGTTTDHVIAARVVLSDGEVVDLDLNKPGYDLLGVYVGSEGTFGIATEATVRLAPLPAAVRTLLADFLNVDDASRGVSAIIAAGVLPAALEMMDHAIIRAVEASVFSAGLPVDAQAVLLVELDGIEAGIDDDAEKVERILRDHGARSIRRAADEKERKKLWAARKGAFGAVGRLMPDVMIQDAVVPRSRLPEVLADTYRISTKYNLQLANVFHAGDGNLHPLICFDLRRGADIENVRQAGREIMETCVRAGGSITGEHGVGVDKSAYLPLIFTEDDMEAMLGVRAAFDPSGLSNPGKIIPMPRGCGEARAVATIEVSEPRAVATGSAKLPDPMKQHDSLESQLDPVPTTPGYETPSRATVLVAARMNEARVQRELSRLLGDVGARRMADFVLELRQGRAERLIEVAPASAEQASDVMKFAAHEHLAVIPAGARNLINGGNSMTRADLILTTRHMNRLLKHEPADLVAACEAGMRFTDFQRELARNGQWLPIDPPDDGTSTVGGIVACGLNGPHSFGYGPVRSFVIGLRAVLADGRQIKAGGNVVKNVAGYDLCKLFTGSYGTLGIITEVTFKLRPLPAETRTIIAAGPPDVLITAGRRIVNGSFAAAVELLSPLMSHELRIDSPPHNYVLLIRFAGSTRAVVTETARALKLLRDEGFNCTTADDDQPLWRKLAAASCDSQLDLRSLLRARPGDLSSLVTELVAPHPDESSRAAFHWHAGLGDGRVRLLARAFPDRQQAVRALAGLRQKAENLGGSLVIEKAPVEIKQDLDSWGSLGSAGELMKRVKRKLDPENILSPGRFFD